MNFISLRSSCTGLVLGLCVGLLGCGSGNATVKGKVTMNGKPVVWGTVTIVDSKGVYHQGDIDLSGNYEIQGVATGGAKLAVVSPNPGGSGGRGAPGTPEGNKGKSAVESDDPREKFLAGKAQNKDDRPRPPEGAWFPIDRKYIDAESSGLTGEVTSGTCVIDINLK